MLPTAKIYLAAKRAMTQTKTTLVTVTNFFNRASSDIICKVSDVQLTTQSSWGLDIQTDSNYFILPLVGGIELKEKQKDAFFVLNGQLLQYQNKQGDTLTLINPYDANDIRFLVVEVKSAPQPLPTNLPINLPISEHKNQLLLLQSNAVKIGLGQYDGRAEDVYQGKESSLLLGYAIQGAFEFQNRLLESGDGVSLWQTNEVEWEALSNNALLLFLEIDV